jgi:tetratricopeptide (TPR) repeat protein
MNRFSFFLLGISITLAHYASAQQSEIVAYPMLVNLDNYSSCNKTADSLKLEKKIKELDLVEEKNFKEGQYSRIRTVDLNGDGKCEILHYFSNEEHGWPYGFLTIYRQGGNDLLKIGDFPGFLVSFGVPDDKGSWLQINAGYMTGSEEEPVYYNSIYKFDGKKYTLHSDPKKTYSEYREKGKKALEEGNLEEAMVWFQNAYISPHHAREDLLHDANNLSMVLLKLEMTEEAYALLQPMVEDNTVAYPKDELANAWFSLGEMAEDEGDNEKALACYERACRFQESAACNDKITALSTN